MIPSEPRRPDYRIEIVGPQNLQNQLLAYVLEKETGASCSVSEQLIPEPVQPQASWEKCLLLVDCAGRVIKGALDEMHAGLVGYAGKPTIALFSLQHGRGVEQNALQYGVKGFFYHDDSLALILKGVGALFRGEIWLSREVLAECVVNNSRKRAPVVQSQAGLSSREMEILALISTGTNNDDIAEKLFISPHTVKTHLYHIFKKINVPNRLQAALWAAKHL